MGRSDPPTPFVPGRELCGVFYAECVRPILERHWPDLPHSAGLLGPGSEVLGFDDEMSTDHDWGPRVVLFVSDDSLAEYAESIREVLSRELPTVIRGYSTHFAQPDMTGGVRHTDMVDADPVDHRVEIQTIRGFFLDLLDCDLNEHISVASWFTFSEQMLRSVTHGVIYHDGIDLTGAVTRFEWYPHDLWLYLLASGWNRISQEEHLMGRAGYRGDEIGSAIIGARLVRDVMRLCFLMEHVYAPYPKWFGTAFNQLACADALLPTLQGALAATNWRERGSHLVAAYEQIASMHNRLDLTDPLPERAVNFHARPFRVISVHGFTEALVATIQDDDVRRIAGRRLIGSVDQFSDSTDIVGISEWKQALTSLYR